MSKDKPSKNILTNPEGPITSLEQDALSRGLFVERLCDALVDKRVGVATGVVIGLTGDWGSGKSSLLNLVETQLHKAYDKAVLVRFNPWLVSGSEVVISQFFAEFTSALNAAKDKNHGLKTKSKELVNKLAKYGSSLAPFADFVIPSGGLLSKASIDTVKNIFRPDKSLSELQGEIRRILVDIDFPIVVLIDELDRVEDEEVRTVAQLIRAIADFENVSYLVAYDQQRVAEALGGGNSESNLIRGRAYLEKIIQYQIPLPILLSAELSDLLDAEIERLESAVEISPDWREKQRLILLKARLIPDLIRTPRDVKRLVGTWHVIEGMVRGDVDWVDLLGFAALMTKAPEVVSKIKNNPEWVMDNPLDQIEIIKRSQDDQYSEKKLALLSGEEDQASAVAMLLAQLFPVLADMPKSGDDALNKIRERRPLLTVLKMGLPSGEVSKQVVDSFLYGDLATRRSIFEDQIKANTISQFLERLEETLQRTSYEGNLQLWLDIAQILSKDPPDWITEYSIYLNLVGEIALLFLRLSRPDEKLEKLASKIVTAFVSNDDLALAPHLLFGQLFAHGIGRKKRPTYQQFLTKSQTETLAQKSCQLGLNYASDSSLIQRIWSPHIIYLLVDLNYWSSENRNSMTEILSQNEALQTIAILLFRDNHVIDREYLEKILDVDVFEASINSLLKNDDNLLSGYSRNSLKRASRELFGKFFDDD